LEHHLQLHPVLGGQITQRADCRAKLALDIQCTGREQQERRFLRRLSRNAKPGRQRAAGAGRAVRRGRRVKAANSDLPRRGAPPAASNSMVVIATAPGPR
jgi:hypothetical protein